MAEEASHLQRRESSYDDMDLRPEPNMPERQLKYFGDFQLGDCIVTHGRTVTEADIVNFAALTGDWHGLHSDAEYAKATRYGERIAHGMLVVSLSTGLWSPEYVSQWAFVAFYGIDGLRFTAPVKIGDTLHVEMVVTECVPKGERGGVVVFGYTVKNQCGQDVLVAVLKLLIAARDSRD